MLNRNIIIFLLLIIVVNSRQYLPNVLIGYGIDMTNGEPHNGISDPETAIRLPIIDLTRSGKNQIYINGTLNIVPDQVSAIADPGMSSTSTTEIYVSVYDTRQKLCESYSMGASFRSVMFGDSLTVTTFEENYEEQGKLYAETTLSVTTYKGQLIPVNLDLNSYFLSVIKKLPQEYNNITCPSFKFFFEEFGTHLVTSMLAGGIVNMQTTFSESVTEEKSMTEISNDIKTQFMFLTSNVNLTYEESEELEELNAVYTSTIVLQGGDPSKFYVNETNQWQATVPASPIMLKYNIEPLYETFKNNALENATIAYFASTIKPGFIKQAPYPYVVIDVACCSYNEYVYCSGGASQTIVPYMFMYDPSTNMWVSKQSMLYGRSGHSLVCIPSKQEIWAIGANSTVDSSVEIYNVVTNLWQLGPSMVSQLFVFGDAIYYNEHIYAVGTSSQYYSFSTARWLTFMNNYDFDQYEGTVSIFMYPCSFDRNLLSLYIRFGTVIYEHYYNDRAEGFIQFDSQNAGNGPSKLVGENLYVFGGYYNGVFVDTIWKLHMPTKVWSIEGTTGIPYYELYGITTVDYLKIHFIGGIGNNMNLNDHLVFTPSSDITFC